MVDKLINTEHYIAPGPESVGLKAPHTHTCVFLVHPCMPSHPVRNKVT